MSGHSKSGLSIRLPTEAVKVLTKINEVMDGPSVNRLLHRMLIESLALAQASDLSSDVGTPLLSGVRVRSDLRVSLSQLAQIDLGRRLTADQAQVVNIPTTVRNRDTLSHFASKMGWSLTQIAAEGIHAFAVLGGANSAIEHLPNLLHATRALKVYDSPQLSQCPASKDSLKYAKNKKKEQLSPAELDISQLNARLFRPEFNKALDDKSEKVAMEVLVDLL